MSQNPPDPASFSRLLVDWQRRHGRHDLPWQQTRDGYRIWLSEIMLQQTQVSTVVPYFARFLARFPDIGTLAAAPLESVLELWAGLGYYARARNLHRCAQEVVARHGGHFPADPVLIAELPGIGRSTAAAIAAFTHRTRAAILDGNVKRVLTRCFGIEGFPGTPKVERKLWTLAETLLPAEGIEAYTQGQMDLGATICTRSRPACAICPMHEICVARQTGRQAELPTPKPRKPVPERSSTVLILHDGKRVLLERRPPSGIWGGLLALPEIIVDGEEAATLSAAESFVARRGGRLLELRSLPPLLHTFTHFRLTLRPLLCRVEAENCVAEAGLEWIEISAIQGAALPTPVRKLLAGFAGQDGFQ